LADWAKAKPEAVANAIKVIAAVRREVIMCVFSKVGAKFRLVRLAGVPTKNSITHCQSGRFAHHL
jgi:regulation of enolase protein 1 (concanavalin A-like superfamily)